MGPSLEETLENALAKVLQQEVSLQAASRTDAGVHAHGQVVTFLLKKAFNLKDLQFRVNCLLPKDIAIVAVEQVPIDFHPTLHALKKEYIYTICHHSVQLPFNRHTSWHFPYLLDIQLMQKAAEDLLGEHDFSTFCNARKFWDRNPICHLQKIEVIPLTSGRLQITMVGDRFLFRMARNIAGFLAYIGCGKLKNEDLPAIMHSKKRAQAGVTPPAHGLTLKQVFYDRTQ